MKAALMEFAPIVLFVYKRPEETRRTLEALRANEGAEQSELFVFSDGPKNPGEKAQVEAVRALFDRLPGFARVTLRTSETNKGLARSVIDGVTEILKENDRVIVLEDDLVTARYFLRFMNEALEKYRDDDRICCVHGFAYPTEHPEIPCFLRRGADCWGWATWHRGWALFRPDAGQLRDEIVRKKLRREFDRGGAFPYTKMLRDQADGRIDSWAVRWYASAFLAEKYTLQSNRMLVENIGFGGAATHYGVRGKYRIALDPDPVDISAEPPFETEELKREHQHFLRLETIPPARRIFLKLKLIFGRIGGKNA